MAAGSRSYLDRSHHPLVFMSEDVAVVDEAAHLRRIGEGNDDLHLASDRHVYNVAVVVDRLRNAVDLDQLVRPLVNMERVELVRLVADRPLLYGAELYPDVGAVHVELLAVDEHCVAIRRLAEHDRTPVRDLAAEILHRAERRGHSDWSNWSSFDADRRHDGTGVLISLRTGVNVAGAQRVHSRRARGYQDRGACTG